MKKSEQEPGWLRQCSLIAKMFEFFSYFDLEN